MSTNYVQPGNVLTLPAPTGGILSGAGFLAGNLFAVATKDQATDAAPVEGAVVGVFTLPKNNSEAMNRGDAIYWDDTGKEVTTTVGANKLIGTPAEDKADVATEIAIRLNGTVAA
jgi:predicted RecA/RadA family phage recombinase